MILVDNSLCDPDAVPGPIEKVPSYDDMEAEMSRGGYAGRSLFKDVVGKNYLTSNTAVWHRLAEIRLWFLVGYPVGMASAS